MIFKAKDPISDQLHELELALQRPLPYRDRQRLEKGLAQRRAGLKGEMEAAYHINFHMGNCDNWAVIHDLRIECKGRTAQIDHLLIDRLLEIYVVESKSFRTKVRYANGGWERFISGDWEGIACPVEQNERHISVLKDLITNMGLAPKRLGLPMPVSFYNIVVVRPSCSIIGRFRGRARIWRMDTLVKKISSDNSGLLNVVKVVSQATLHRFAAKLAACHKPATKPKVNFTPQPSRLPEALPAPAEASVRCHGCGNQLSVAEADYCRQNDSRFGRGLLCRKCQGYAPKDTPANVLLLHDAPVRIENRKAPRCEMCGAAVDQKVVYFCRINSSRFRGRLLCRACQPSASRAVTTAVPV
ncbi:MAG: nuclease-related domain-containing protein [Limisphaerales bacterium]